MKKIPLIKRKTKRTKNFEMYALVDDEDYDELIKYNWYADSSDNDRTFYVKRQIRLDNGKQKSIKMHRQLLCLTDPKIKGDHIDHNGLNNQRSNLRISTHLQNSQNGSSRNGSSSKYLGVARNSYTNNGGKTYYTKWMATIRVNGVLKTISRHPYTPEGEIEAAKAYDAMAIKHFGEFANPNFK